MCPRHFSENPLDTDTRIIRTLRHVPFVSVLTRFHSNSIIFSSVNKSTDFQFTITIELLNRFSIHATDEIAFQKFSATQCPRNPSSPNLKVRLLIESLLKTPWRTGKKCSGTRLNIILINQQLFVIFKYSHLCTHHHDYKTLYK